MTRTPLDLQRTTGRRVSYSSIYALLRHMTVFENIAFGLRVRPKVTRPTERDVRVRVLDLPSRTTDLVEATSARKCRPRWLPLMLDIGPASIPRIRRCDRGDLWIHERVDDRCHDSLKPKPARPMNNAATQDFSRP
jgi:ABC-type sugar transport system ATPase subunit